MDIELLTRDNAEQQAPVLAARATELARGITDEATFKQAGEYVVTLKGALKKWDSIIGPVCDSARKAWQEANGLRSKVEAPLKSAIAEILTPAMNAFRREEERKRRDEEERLNREAKAKADEETLNRAVEFEKDGNAQAATAVLDEPIAPAPVVVPKPAKVAGLTEREVWSGECFDPMALVKAVAEGRAPLASLEPNMPFINSQARALKGEFKIPGCRATKRTSFAGV